MPNIKPMQIGIDVRCLMHKEYSGVPEYTYNLLQHLFIIDRQNQYQLFYNSNQPIEENLPQFSFSNVSYQGYHYPNKLINASLKYLRWPKIDRLLKNLDLFLLPNFNFIALSNNCRKIITTHDISYEYYPEFYNTKRNFWHKFINPQKLIANFDTIIADSQSTRRDLQARYNIQPEKIRVIWLAVDHNNFRPYNNGHPNLNLVTKKYQLPKNFILYLGTLEPRKNIETLIQSFNLLKNKPKFSDLKLVIAGPKGWKHQPIFSQVNQSPHQKDIQFIGYVSREDKPYLYNLAKVFVFPSYYEGFGLPVLEAQACGCPVIAGLNSSFPEVLADSAILINPYNIKALSQSIGKILTNNTLRKELVFSGIKNCQRFTWPKTAQRTLELFTI